MVWVSIPYRGISGPLGKRPDPFRTLIMALSILTGGWQDCGFFILTQSNSNSAYVWGKYVIVKCMDPRGKFEGLYYTKDLSQLKYPSVLRNSRMAVSLCRARGPAGLQPSIYNLSLVVFDKGLNQPFQKSKTGCNTL